MPFDSHKLCRLVENYPCLYNPNLVDYSKKDVIEKAWNEISFTMKESASECRTRWYNIRGNYSKTLKSGIFGSSSERRKYYLDEELSFLRPYMKSINKLRVLQEKPYEIELCEEVPLHEEQIFVNGECAQDADEAPTPPKRKKPNNDKVQVDPLADAVISLLNQVKEEKNNDCADLYFVKSLLPDLKKMSDAQKYRFKRKILEIVGEILYENDEVEKESDGIKKENGGIDKDDDNSQSSQEIEWARIEEESQEF